MTLTFIVTTYNIQPYVGRCLHSVAACAQPGDRVIVVDDGSTDGTAEALETILAQSAFAPEVTLHTVLLGTNTMGGVGIAGNTGLYEALSDPHCEAVFFVDGDDWLEPTGFLACRRAFEAARSDILIGNYAEYDETKARYRRPADAVLWAQVRRRPASDPNVARHLALKMIAVPWRKFYRADFLRAHRLRFPEGDFFFEDNPFHWEVCLKAETIAFHDRVLCHHRVNRPGQTMASTGTELTAFFDHYDTIRGALPPAAPNLEAVALTWLLNNMSWHITRLQPAAFWPYAARAAKVLAAVSEPIWQATMPHFARSTIGPVAGELRRGDIAGVIGVWMQAVQAPKISALQARVSDLTRSLDALRPQLKHSAHQVSALHEIQRYQALTALPGDKETPLQSGE